MRYVACAAVSLGGCFPVIVDPGCEVEATPIELHDDSVGVSPAEVVARLELLSSIGVDDGRPDGAGKIRIAAAGEPSRIEIIHYGLSCPSHELVLPVTVSLVTDALELEVQAELEIEPWQDRLPGEAAKWDARLETEVSDVFPDDLGPLWTAIYLSHADAYGFVSSDDGQVLEWYELDAEGSAR